MLSTAATTGMEINSSHGGKDKILGEKAASC
jgi:hypothetical protein